MGIITNKRAKFLLASLALSGLLGFISFPLYRDNIALTLVFSFGAWFLSFLTLGRLRGVEIVTFPILPTLFALGASLNQYFFPNLHLSAKGLTWALFFFCFYTLLLALNVFKAERTKGESIPLEKAAKPVIFLATFGVSFLLLTALYKFELGVFLSMLGVFVLVFILAVNALWFLTVSDLLERRFFAAAGLVAMVAVQIALAFSFFPWKAHLRGLSEAVFFYAALGITRAYQEKHLKYSIVLEYILVSLAVFLFARFI